MKRRQMKTKLDAVVDELGTALETLAIHTLDAESDREEVGPSTILKLQTIRGIALARRSAREVCTAIELARIDSEIANLAHMRESKKR